jgi:hypothetical protein
MQQPAGSPIESDGDPKGGTTGLAAKRDIFVSFTQADQAITTWIAWIPAEAGYTVAFQDWDFRGNLVGHLHQAPAHRALTILPDRHFGAAPTLGERSACLAQALGKQEDRLVPGKVGSSKPISPATLLGR